MFLEIEKKDKSKIALVDSSLKKITYGELIEIILEIARVIPKRSVVFILCKNCVEAAAVYLAALSNKAVPLMINAAADKSVLEKLFKTYTPAFIWKPVESVSGSDNVIFRIHSYALIDCSCEKYELYDDLALLLSTSGSTGSPKLVRHSYMNLEVNARNIAGFFHIKDTDKPMLDLPIHYTYGLSVLNSHIFAGTTVALTDFSLMQKEYWEFFKAEEATSITGVPYTFEMLKRFRIFRMELPSLELLSQGGGKLNEDLQKEYAQFANDTNRRFIITYGQTEGSARMAYLPPEDAITKIGRSARLFPGEKLYIVNDQGEPVEETGEIGELVCEGKNVTLGYAESRQDLMRGDDRKGVLYTGDMAKKDSDGYLYIVGRKKRFLKIFGNRIGLDECEQLISEKFDLECACTGTDNEMCIYINKDNFQHKVKEFISHRTQINAIAFKVYFVKSLPRNEAGKIIYGDLK